MDSFSLTTSPFLVERLVNQSSDSNIGSAQTKADSLSSFLATLAPVAIYALIYAVLFIIFRRWYPRIYRPRTFLGSLSSRARTPDVSETLFGWIGDFYRIPDTWILNHHTLDGFLFLRFLKISVICCVVGCIITWPVLFPINATGGGGKKQLAILTMANVSDNYFKYFAHCICAILFFSFILYMITRESIYYINLRQAYLMSPMYAGRISSRTVLYNAVPEPYMNEAKLRAMLGPTVRRVWLATDTSDLQDKVEERDKTAMKLEGSETKLIRKANVARLKAEKKAQKKGQAPPSPSEEALEGTAGASSATQYLNPKDRPTHRLGKIPFIGQKVDSIDWCRAQLQKVMPEVQNLQAEQKEGHSKKLCSAFVEFETVSDAQAAYQSLTHHQVLHMYPRHIGMSPNEVIWSNLRIRWWERCVRQSVTIAAVVALIIFWSLPVAFVGAISNLQYLTNKLTFLRFVYNLPHWLLGVVTGLLPSLLLAVLMSVLPIFLRLMAQQGGDPTLSAVELTVQNSYFGFQVVQVFLVATIGSAASSVVTKIINNPTDAPSLLAKNIPTASNFYLSYFVLQGLGVVSGVLLGLTGLALFMLMGKLFDKTPRKMYQRWVSLSGLGWGTLFPIYTNLFVVAVCYAAIAPLVLGFAAIGLYFFYFAYRYNLMFVADSNIDTKGRIYPRALAQVFVGLYIAEVCLIGLFAIGVGNSVGALGPLVLMIIFLIYTALYHISLDSALGPLIKYLPKSIDAEERRLLATEDGREIEINPNSPATSNEPKTAHEALAEASPVHNVEEQSPGASGPVQPVERTYSAASHPSNGNASSLNHPPHKKPSMLAKWLRPDIYNDYATMRRLVPSDSRVIYTVQDEDEAYFHPSITSSMPLLWIPRDVMGVSAQEVKDTKEKGVPITDEGAFLNDKNNIVWDAESARPPIWEEEVLY